jgi:uncharacterized membrane protein YgaE (UPF0421/DUF939 family)
VPTISGIAEAVATTWATRSRDFLRLLWPTLQTAVAAGLSWDLAVRAFHHPRPIFAPIIAIAAMGFTAGRRSHTAVLLVLGTIVGIGVADLARTVLDEPGGVAVAVVVFGAMSVVLTFSREPAFVTQAGISALLIVTVERQSGLTPARLEDALLGGTVAVVMSMVLFPIDPIAAARRSAAPLFSRLQQALQDVAVALRTGDTELAAAARAAMLDHRALAETISVALEATRIAPRRRRDRVRVEAFARACASLGPITRASRVIAGTAVRAARAGETPLPELAAAVDVLASAVHALHDWLDANAESSRVRAIAGARAAAELAARSPHGGGRTALVIAHLVEAVAVHVATAAGEDPVTVPSATPPGTP